MKCSYCNAELTKDEIELHEGICNRCYSEIVDVIQSRKEN